MARRSRTSATAEVSDTRVQRAKYSDVVETLAELQANIQGLNVEIRRLAEDVCALKQLLYGDGNAGLRTTVEMLRAWVEEQKAREEETRRAMWQLRVAMIGWALATLVTVASWFVRPLVGG